MKIVKEHINEKFTDDDTDPIYDMGIGWRFKIIEWLKKYSIENYIINDDLSIDINGGVDLHDKKIENFPNYIQFNKIKGICNFKHNNLTSLRGSPKYVKGDFYCNENNLKSLEFAPKIVKGDFVCWTWLNKAKKFRYKNILKVCKVGGEIYDDYGRYDVKNKLYHENG